MGNGWSRWQDAKLVTDHAIGLMLKSEIQNSQRNKTLTHRLDANLVAICHHPISRLTPQSWREIFFKSAASVPCWWSEGWYFTTWRLSFNPTRQRFYFHQKFQRDVCVWKSLDTTILNGKKKLVPIVEKNSKKTAETLTQEILGKKAMV